MKRILTVFSLLTLLILAGATSDVFAQTGFRILDIGEREYDNGPALSILFSEPLLRSFRHDDMVRVTVGDSLADGGWVLSQDARRLWFPHVEANTHYTVTVLESMESESGERLGHQVRRHVTTRKVEPAVAFASSGLVLPKGIASGLPIATINVPEVDLTFFRINKKGMQRFVRWQNPTSNMGVYALEDVKEYATLVYTGRFQLNPEKNRRVVRHIPLGEMEAFAEPGLYFAVLKRPGAFPYGHQTSFFMVTDLGLSLRTYKEESVVAVSSLATGKALQGVWVRFYDRKGYKIDEGFTDELGLFKSRASRISKASLIKAEIENGDKADIAWLTTSSPRNDLSDFAITGRPDRPVEIYPFAPRDLYRPSERVPLSVLVRNQDGEMAEIKNLYLRWMKPTGKVAHQETLELDETGYASTTLALPGDATTGRWRVEVRFRPGRGRTADASFEFQVEEFLPERMAMELDSDRPVLVKTLDHEIKITGRYLYGAPASGNRVEGTSRMAAIRECFPQKLKGFLFGRLEDASWRSSSRLGSTTLDSDGKGALQFREDVGRLRSPLTVTSTVTLFESGGRPITRRLSRLWVPEERLPGLRCPDNLSESSLVASFPVELVVADATGGLVAVNDLMVRMIKIDRNSYWEYSENSGWNYRVNEKRYTFSEDVVSTSSEKPVVHTLKLPQGRYAVEVVDPATGLTATREISYGMGYGYSGDSPHPSKVGLTLDKTSYTPGETVRVKIIPPADGEALVMVEGKRLLWAKRLSVKNTGTTVDIPVESTWKSHDIYISAVVLRKTEAREAETPLRSLGVVHLPFNREDRNLTLSVASPTVWQKEAPMPVAVTAVNHAGDPVSAKVWVAAVDVGILSITGYSSPNPFEWFFARRWYGVQSRDIYGKVVEIEPSMAAALRFGGDGDMTLGGGKPQVEVKLFSKVFGPFETDRSGRVQMDIPMDDFSGKIRLMAVAFDARRFGSTEKEATVTPPLVVQLSTPRFMAPEDTSLVTVDVTRMVEGEGQYEISATAQGPICVDGESKFLTLSEKKRKIITWPISAVCDATHPAFGVGEIRMTASGEGVTKTISRQFAVRPGYPGEAREKRVRIKPGETIQLKDEAMKGLMPVTVGGGVTVSNRLPLNTDSYVQDLLQYPYGCLEQTTSRAFPQLWLVPDVAQVMGVKALAPSKRREILNKAVARIISMQRHNGSFGLWSSSSPEDPWLSCYATDFLLSARSMGVDVPIQALRKALGRQRSWLVKGVGGDLRGDHGAVFAVKSYAAFNLSRAQSSHLASMRTLADNHLDDAADMLSAVRLALALKQSGDTRRSGVVAEKALAIKTDHDTWRRDYGSDVRDLAMGMALLNSAKLLPDAMTGLLDKLEDELRKTWWLSTQEKAALFFLSLSGSQAQQKVSLSLVEKGETRLFHEKGPFTANLSAESLEKEGISITNTGEQGLYLSSVVTGYNKKAPEKESKDILIRREFFTMDGHLVAPEDMRKVKAGSVFLVNLRVAATQRIPDALVVDFLPAGFEIENPNFENSIHADETKVRGRKVWRHQEESRITHAEYLEDRFVAAVELSKNREFNLFYVVRAVSPGRFTVPPPFAESMYKPEIRGIGESGEVVEVGEMKL